MNRSPVIALAALIAIAAFPAAGEPPNVEELQASARGLASGPLCSLALRVDVGETLDLVVPGASRDAGWGKVGLSTAALGTICLPDANRPERIDRGGNWSAGRLVATFRGGRTITLHASQMSAGIVVETSTDRVRLFAGTHERLLGRDPGGRRKLYGFPGQAKPIGPVTPAYAAVRDGEALRSSALAAGKALASPPGGWTVVYWADKTHFVRSDGPLAGRGRHGDAYPRPRRRRRLRDRRLPGRLPACPGVRRPAEGDSPG